LDKRINNVRADGCRRERNFKIRIRRFAARNWPQQQDCIPDVLEMSRDRFGDVVENADDASTGVG